jgi:hypothetical protein
MRWVPSQGGVTRTMCLARERDGRRGALGGYLDAPVLRLGGAGPLDLWANRLGAVQLR